MAFLYYRPIASYLETRSEPRPAEAQVVALRAEKAASRAEACAHDERRGARPRGAADRLRQARRAPLHRQGHPGLAAPAPHSRHPDHLATVSRVEDRDVVERQIGRRPRAFRRVAARCPFGMPAVTEQEPYDDDRRSVPDDLLPHLPPPDRRRLPPRGGGGVERWSAAVAPTRS